MTKGLFEVICPACGAEIELVSVGEGWCRACRASYLVRLGHLIAIDRRGAVSPAGMASEQGIR
jgi:hypothetical protein